MKFKYYKPRTYPDKWGFRKFKSKDNRPTFLLHTLIGHFWLWLSDDEYDGWPDQGG
jgi:hypothetical protein